MSSVFGIPSRHPQMTPFEIGSGGDQGMTKRLGELLLAEKLITTEQLEEAMEAQCLYGGRLGTSIIELGFLKEEEIARALSRKLHLPYIEPAMLMKIPAEVIALVPQKLALKHYAIPVRLEKKRLYLAMSDPTNLTIIDALAFRLGFIIVPVVVPEIRLMLALQKYYQLELSPRLNALNQNLSARQRHPAKPAPSSSPVAEETPKKRKKPAPEAETILEVEDKDILVDEEDWPLLGDADNFADLSEEEYQELINMPKHLRLSPPEENGRSGADRRVTIEVEKLNAEEQHPFTLFCKSLTLAQNRDDIADAIIEYIAPGCQGVALLMVKNGSVMGWKGASNGDPIPDFDLLSISLDQPSVLQTVAASKSYYLGPLNKEVNNVQLASQFSPQLPKTVLVIPLLLRQRLVTFLYLQDSAEKIRNLLSECQILAVRAVMAFEMLILQNKIQMGITSHAGSKS